MPHFLQDKVAQQSPLRCIIQNCRKSERGVALVEFALVLPVLFAVVWGGIELARAIRVSKMVSTMSREVANSAFRECSPGLESAQLCLDSVSERLAPLSAPGMSGVIVISSVYWVNPETNAVELAGSSRAFADPTDPNPGLQSRFCIAGGCQNPIPASLVQDTGMISVGEVYSKFSPIIGGVPGTLSFNPRNLYEATVF